MMEFTQRTAVPPVQALTLTERLAIFRSLCDRHRAPKSDFAQGQAWIERCREMPPFARKPELWDLFLDAQDLTEEDLRCALGVPRDTLIRHAEGILGPDAFQWSGHLDEALTEYPWESPPAIKWPDSVASQMKLLTFSRPVVNWAFRRLRRRLSSLETSHDLTLVAPENGLESLLSAPFLTTAYGITHRTLVLELNIARLRGELQGNTPQERFESFVGRLEDPGYVCELYDEYCVMARDLVESLTRIADFCGLFLQHLAEDWPVLAERFFGEESPGPLAKVSMSGDSHREGQRVTVLEFETGRKLVYKPRSLRIDRHFQELLEWLNERMPEDSALAPFRTLDSLDRQSHGWIEFVETGDCSTEDELRRFYIRQGQLLAVLYAMLATDFHYENLIASGEHPLLIDLESLFHPSLTPSDQDQLEEMVRDAFSYSVLRTALLPVPRVVQDRSIPFDIGGLTDMEGQEIPSAAAVVDMSMEDEARIDRLRVRMPGSQNIPTLQGKKPKPYDYTEEIVTGFTEMYGLILNHRDGLLAADGPIQRFAGDDIRFIFRNTRVYALLSSETRHPDLQRDALERDLHFLRLWGKLEQQTDVAELIHSELDALWSGDVPFFHTRTDSVDIFDHEDRRHPGHLATSCLEEVVRHISRLDEENIERQTWFIRGAMACQKVQPGHTQESAPKASSFEPTTADPTCAPQQFLEEACRIGDQLAELALRGTYGEEDGATWLGMILRRESIWQFLPLGIDLYNGLGGIALFLAYLGEASGRAEYSELARAALNVLRKQQQRTEDAIVTNGAFTGWGGIVYVYTHLARLWDDPSLLHEALRAVEPMAHLASADENFEVLHGNSGGILALDCLYETHPAPEVLRSMAACGQHLLSNARTMNEGWGWICQALNCRPLAGFSHGGAGIAAALEALYRRTGQEEYRRATAHALSYERSLFSAEQSNWADIRNHYLDLKDDELPPPSYPVAWCNGAPGIGLARFRMLSLQDATVRKEVEAALTTTRKGGFGYSHSLCHGDLGNLELLIEARRSDWISLDDDTEVDTLGLGSLEAIRQRGWSCGTPRGIETPGLMLGLAGIGYGFLRLYDPENVPSVLLLAPPPSP